MLKSHLTSVAIATAVVVGLAAPSHAQAPAQPKPVPLKVTVTISRYQGEKRISSLPYTLSVSLDPNRASNGTNVSRRIGSKVPIISTSFTPVQPAAADKAATPATPATSFTYQDVGTSIDCFAYFADDTGRFRLQITVDESSVYEAPTGRGQVDVGRPTLRSFRTSESMMLKDGQSQEMSSTPDRLTGEIVKVDVALAVVK